ncbi:GGDEF domain-containing protein [Paucibacter sp. Y2R2-4]|uniref:GGDEF domain-containing protein n=1 Tax=Paucibacter sp. Y2R2-4 TaxID=2893553 RepID=UPI0021E4CA4B|nr:GGDEF domain-containing protein [Paucibacter sp. Y2R2-4]MCV2351806.1 GGDEF domain-containing protein [Paucibacter sp. Y2R2-4]
MTSQPTATAPPDTLNALESALDKSQEVKVKVEDCADDLAVASDLAKARIARGEKMLPADQVLQNTKAIGIKVQDCADDLQEVADTLAYGVAEVKDVEQALIRSREALAESEAALAASRHAERAASTLAMHDQKTALPNRTLFDDRLAQAIAGADRHGWMLGVMFLDLDRFKLINDSHGHAAGDTVLKVVAQRLLSQARDEDTVCRNGGDEFLYLLINPTSRDDVARIAGQVKAAIAAPISHGALQLVITPSIGIALYPLDGQSGDILIANADAAMYRAKSLPGHCVFFESTVPTVNPSTSPG